MHLKGSARQVGIVNRNRPAKIDQRVIEGSGLHLQCAIHDGVSQCKSEWS